jgi:hypothetical protein
VGTDDGAVAHWRVLDALRLALAGGALALWCFWLPSAFAVYFMPSTLQFPVLSVILRFWMSIFKFIHSAR